MTDDVAWRRSWRVTWVRTGVGMLAAPLLPGVLLIALGNDLVQAIWGLTLLVVLPGALWLLCGGVSVDRRTARHGALANFGAHAAGTAASTVAYVVLAAALGSGEWGFLLPPVMIASAPGLTAVACGLAAAVPGSFPPQSAA